MRCIREILRYRNRTAIIIMPVRHLSEDIKPHIVITSPVGHTSQGSSFWTECAIFPCDLEHVAFKLSPQKRGCLLGMGTCGGGGGGGGGRESGGSTADTARKRPYRKDRGPPPEQWMEAVSPRHCVATSALRNCCFNCGAGQSHKDNVRCTTLLRNNPKRKN